ncbi:MAG: ribose-5-phosphate isomerase RpiA [Pseudomonadota bacterium]
MNEQREQADAAAGGAHAAKRAAAAVAVDLVSDGMIVGLGTGSTAAVFVDLLAERMMRDGLSVVCVATSIGTAAQAGGLGLPLTTLSAVASLDLTIDGADEVDGQLNLIKGGGGALLCEKIVAAASDRMVVIADASKQVANLGHFPLPVEIVRFGVDSTEKRIAEVLARHDVEGTEIVRRRTDAGTFVTDEGHEIVDLHLGRIGDPAALEAALARVPGVVDSGLFIGVADRVIFGASDGGVAILDADG